MNTKASIYVCRGRTTNDHTWKKRVSAGRARLIGYSLLQLPFAIVQRANIPCLEPAGDTVEVESVLYPIMSEGQGSNVIRTATHVADAPGSIALLAA